MNYKPLIGIMLSIMILALFVYAYKITGNLEVTGNLNVTGNELINGNSQIVGFVNATSYKLKTDSVNHYITDNDTCVIIYGDTSKIEVC